MGIAVAVGVGALLIATGVYLGVGKVWLELGRPADTPPAYYTHLIWMPAFVGALLRACAVFFILAVCITYCKKRWQGVITGVLIVGLAAYLRSSPSALWVFLPSVLFTSATNASPVAFYVGLAVQLALGAWLLGWLPIKHRDEIAPA